MIKILNLFFVLTSAIMGCNGSASKTEQNPILIADTLIATGVQINEHHNFEYRLNEPDETFKLPSILVEISGLGMSESGEFLYAVQDEKGIIFKLSKKTGEILEEVNFHKDGDYEGIEVVGDKVYVVKSTGTIYEVSNLGQPTQQMKKTNTFLTAQNDVEGLGYDRKNNRLLIACKGIPATGESFEIIRYKKVIYGFDLATGVLGLEPVYTIQLEDIRNYLEQNTGMREYEKLVEFFSAGKENLTFNPSAIAIHPLTNEVYVVSSSGKVLVILNEAGKVVHIEKLEKEIHTQPEGLVFDKDGTLYISNEGKGKKATIHRFAVKKE
jgi:uncharacterized protein YjiK